MIAGTIAGATSFWETNATVQKSMDKIPNIAGDFNKSRLLLKSELGAFNSEVHHSIELLKNEISLKS